VARAASIVPLTPEHATSSFDCGSDAQTQWLRRHALQAQQSGSSRVYVAVEPGTDRVVGYYALAAGSVELRDATARLTKGIGRHPIPVVILTRLGVDRSAQGRGLGAALVRDALLRVHQAADVIGVRSLLIHAESDGARAFYEHLAEFEPSPTDPLHLFLLLKDLRRALG
jgi:GNAT superfamily N-acetyltransferase